MPFAKVNEIDLYYETHGKGKPLVFISGFSTHHLTWRAFIQPLVDSFQVILLDNRGSGQSSAPSEPYTIETMAKDTLALLDHLKLNKASFVGSSMGTAITQTIAHIAPERVDKAILIAPFAKLPMTSILKTETTGKLLLTKVPMDIILETVIPWLFSRDFVTNTQKVLDKKEEMSNNPFPQSLEGFKGQFEALRNFDSTSFLKDLAAEFLLIAGEEDLSTPFSCAKFVHENLQKSHLHPFPRMGHMAHAEKRKEVLDLITSFAS